MEKKERKWRGMMRCRGNGERTGGKIGGEKRTE